jgi:LPXTG-site transpeptidase (sortase) family protein
MRQPMFEGVGLATLHYGPGHWPGTAMPGHLGNAVVAGHRITNTHPFFDIDLLAPGDLVFIDMDGSRFVYEMTEHLIVGPRDTWIAHDTEDATLTLFACHPKGSKARRYVVRARLTSTPLPRMAAPRDASLSGEPLPGEATASPADPSEGSSLNEPASPPADEGPPPCNSLLCLPRRAA